MGKDLKGRELGKGIVQRKDGMYHARFVNRFGVRQSIYDKDLPALKKEFIKAQYEDQMQANSFDKNLILDDWYAKWMEIYKEGDIRPSTKLIYNQIYRDHISPTLGQTTLVTITNLHIKNLMNRLKNEKGLGYEVRNKARIILQDVFNKAIMNELMLRNPALGIRVLRDKKESVRVLSVEDQYDFFDCCSGTFYDNAFIVQANLGLRPGELYGLKIEDIDLENNTVHIQRTLSYQKFEGDEGKTFHFGPPKTESSDRVIPMTQACKLALQKQILQKRIVAQKSPKQVDEQFKDLLFTTKFNTPLNTAIYSAAIEKVVKEINLTRIPIEYLEVFSPHCFRHTFATRCFEAGIDFKVIQKYLGHASINMTMDLYVHVTDTLAGDELPKLDKLLQDIDNLEEPIIAARTERIDKEESKVIDFDESRAMLVV